jgi:hypothetical protein
VERKLRRNVARIEAVREQLVVAELQLDHFADVATDAELEAIVADSPLASAEQRDATRSAEVMRRDRDRLRGELARLEREQDDLLDELANAR